MTAAETVSFLPIALHRRHGLSAVGQIKSGALGMG